MEAAAHISRLQHGGEPIPLDLNTVIGDVARILERVIGEDVQVVLELATGLGCIRADRGEIEQILMNFATNARDAMPNGGTFTISTQNADVAEDSPRGGDVKPGRYVQLSVRDTGMGMSESVRLHAFEPFFTTKPLGRGTGLGLATIYEIVRQSDGHISIFSTPGIGTTSEIYLPRYEGPPLALPNLEARSEYPQGTETILLLENDKSLRQLMCEFLRASGYNVLQAESGGHAVDLASQYLGPIPLLLSDLVLPDIAGPLAVTKIRALHPEIKVLYVSGYADVPLTQQLVAEGATLMQKPVPRKELLRRVDELLHTGPQV